MTLVHTIKTRSLATLNTTSKRYVSWVTHRFYKSVNFTDQYYAKVTSKINLKLGGTNHILPNQRALYENNVVIGIDVTRPSPGPARKTAPSMAAMIATIDEQVFESPHLHNSLLYKEVLNGRIISSPNGQ